MDYKLDTITPPASAVARHMHITQPRRAGSDGLTAFPRRTLTLSFTKRRRDAVAEPRVDGQQAAAGRDDGRVLAHEVARRAGGWRSGRTPRCTAQPHSARACRPALACTGLRCRPSGGGRRSHRADVLLGEHLDALAAERNAIFDSLRIRECQTVLCAPSATGRNNPFIVSSRQVAVADVIPKKPSWWLNATLAGRRF